VTTAPEEPHGWRRLTGRFGSQPRRKLSYELLDCAWHGHVLVGTDAADIRPEDDDIVREFGDLRWHRCLRCDDWVPRPPPAAPTRPLPADRDEISVPLRGRPLRDRYVLRVIAVDRFLHFLILSVLAAAVFVFVANKSLLQRDFVRIVTDLQGGVGGPVHSTSGSVEHELTRLFAISTRNLVITGVVIAAYALLEGVEAVGLWRGRRWAEYLTFIATVVLVPLEVYEISRRPTALKSITLVINVAIVVYLLLAKRLFGLRGGRRAEQAIRARDASWSAIQATTPRGGQAPP
jgi:uncharacterized membrane protein (DUF2068 family)